MTLAPARKRSTVEDELVLWLNLSLDVDLTAQHALGREEPDMKRTRLELLTQQRGVRARRRRDERLLHAVKAQQRLDTQRGNGAAIVPRPLDAGFTYLTEPHD